MRVSGKKAIQWGGLGVFVLAAMLIILPLFLNPDYVQDLVLKHIQQTFGSHVQVGRTSFALFPSPHFLANDITIKDQPDSHAVFRANSMSLELGIGQLLQKKLVVREFILDHPEIEIRRENSGAWRFLGYSTHDSSLSFLGSFLVLGRLEVTNGKIIVIDETPSESVRGVVLDDVAFLSETSYEDVSLLSHLQLSGKLRQNQDSASFGLSGAFEATSTLPLSSSDSQHVVFEQMTFSGNMQADNIALDQLAEFGSYEDVLARIPGRLKAESQLKWVKKGRTSQFNFSNMTLTNPAISLAGNANIESLENGHQMTSIALRSSNLNLEMVRKFIPLAWLHDSATAFWKAGQWGGEVEVAEARITSSTRSDVDTSITGTFRVKNGFLSMPEWPTVDHVQGTIVIEPDRIHVSEAQGLYDEIPVDLKQGVVLFKEVGPWADVEVQGSVQAKKVWEFVSKLRDSSSDHHGLAAWTVSQGEGILRLRFAGRLFDEHGLTFQDGDYEPTNVVLSIPGFPHALSRAHGKIQFSPDSTVLDEIQGDLGTYPLTMNGTIIHQDVLRLEPMTVTAGFDGQDVLAYSDQHSPESGLQITGPLHTSVTMRGPLSRLNLKGNIDGKNAMVSIPLVLQKEAGQPGMLDFDGQLHSSGAIRFKRVELAMLPLLVRGEGIVRFLPTWSWQGRFDSGPISLGVLPKKIRMFGGAIESGMLDIQLGGKGVGGDWKKWKMKGWVALTDGVISIPGSPVSVENVFFRLRIDHEFLDFKRMEFHINDSQAVVTGFVKQWNTSPQVSMMWNSPQFDLDLLIPDNERSIMRDGVEWLTRHGKLEGSLFIERPRFKEFSGKKLSAVLNLHDNLVSIDRIQTSVEKHGNVKGRVFVHLPPGKPAAMRASFEGNNLPFEKTLMVLGDERRLISGQLDIRGKIQGHGRDARGVIPTLEGGIELSLRNGYVRKGTVLPKILRILNLPNVLRGKVSFEKTGFPYETVNGTLKVEKGIFSSKDFRLRSPVMNTTAAGMYDFKRDHLEGVVAVSPFGAYSDALKSIPLFGTIFSGERKGIATAMFNVIGPLQEPKVIYMPKESFVNGLTGLAQFAFDILKNVVGKPANDQNSPSQDSVDPLPKATGPSLKGPPRLKNEPTPAVR